METFDNFELSFEWKIKEAGNSGIKYNVSEELTNFVIVNGNDRSYGDPAKFRYVQRFGYYGFSSKKDF